MRAIRRTLQVVALVGTILIGVLAVSLIVSQTPWFRDWLRRYIVRESKQYLNGQLTIGGLGGNLLFGVNLSDVSVDVSGERVVAVKALELNYSIFVLISKGIVLDKITLDQPVLRIQHDSTGWNLANLIKKERQEADRRGPMRPISLPAIDVSDASLSIEDHLAGDGYALPARIDDLDLQAGFEYAPVHYSLDLDHVSFRGSSPGVALRELTGKVAVRDDNLYLDQIVLKTAETSVTIDGVVQRYLRTPVLNLTATGNVSLPEIGRLVPSMAGYGLHPAIDLKASGPAENLTLDVNVRSEAGNARGTVAADVKAPDFGVRGDVDVERLNLALVLRDPKRRSDITGHAKVNLRIASRPAAVRITDRMTGTFAFTGPHVVAMGYEARNVTASGRLDGPRITLDARGAAYGGTATARGFIVAPAPGRRLTFDLQGKANGVDLRDLPARIGAPRLATTLSVAGYHVRGEGPATSGTASLNRSTVEGATIAEGTTAEFSTDARTVSYQSRGNVADLDLRRIGVALKVTALAQPRYASRINGSFDVSGRVPRSTRLSEARSGQSGSMASAMTLNATGTLTDTEVLGGRVPEMGFEAHLDRGALTGRADGRFEDFNPATIANRPQLDGRVTGTVNANFSLADIAAPITPESVTADGKVTLAPSTVGGLRIDSADIQGKYASDVGDITAFHITGPDVKANASGRLALDRTSDSNLKYHVDAVNLAELARLAGRQTVAGSAILDGTLTGNAASLKMTGTLDGSNFTYGANNALDFDSRYTVTVPDLRFADAKVEAQTHATFLQIGGMKLNSVTATTAYDRRTLDFTANVKERTRELDAKGQLVLHPDHQEVHLVELALRTQGVEWRTAPDSHAAVHYGAGRVELTDVRLVSGDQQLDVAGILPVKGGAASGAIDVHARNVDLQQLEALMLQNRGFTGTLTADGSIAGSTDAPRVNGSLQILNGAFQGYHYDSLTAKLDYGSKRVGIDATLQQSPTQSITAKGSVPTTLFAKSPSGAHVEAAPAEAIDLHVTSTALDLGVIQGFTSQVTNVVGTLQADVQISGSGEDPHLLGYVDIQNGAFGVPAAGETFTGLTTRIHLERDRVSVRRFELLDRHGEKLAVAGDLALHERLVGAIDISIDSDNFEVLRNELGDVQVQSALKITGDLRRPRIVGDVRLDAGRIEVDRVMQLFYDPYSVEALPDVVSAERMAEKSGSAEDATKAALARARESAAAPGARKAAETPAPGGMAEALALDVHVIVPDNLVLRGKDIRPAGPTGTAFGSINITVGGDLRVRKDPGGRIIPVGTVETVRGTYEFQGRRFDLERGGTIRFIGQPTVNPLLDVAATRTIPNTGVVARVHITGSLLQPELALSSTPPLDESDILSLIVFNRQVNELGTGERSSLAATAGGIATGFIAAPLGASIGKALDLDLFEITTNTESGELGAGITLGQQLGDRAFLKLRQEFGERSTTEFMLEYQLSKFLRLQATGAPETTGSANRVNQRRVERAGIDLIFFFSY